MVLVHEIPHQKSRSSTLVGNTQSQVSRPTRQQSLAAADWPPHVRYNTAIKRQNIKVARETTVPICVSSNWLIHSLHYNKVLWFLGKKQSIIVKCKNVNYNIELLFSITYTSQYVLLFLCLQYFSDLYLYFSRESNITRNKNNVSD